MALAPIDFPNDPYFGESFEASNGLTYTWLGDRWRTNVGNVDINIDPEDFTFNTLSDVNVADPLHDFVVYWDNPAREWRAKSLQAWLPNVANTVYSDQDFDITGQFHFVTDPLLNLEQLTNVTITNPQIGDTLKWSGVEGGWINVPSEAN